MKKDGSLQLVSKPHSHELAENTAPQTEYNWIKNG
jgi:hypothetical protein